MTAIVMKKVRNPTCKSEKPLQTTQNPPSAFEKLIKRLGQKRFALGCDVKRLAKCLGKHRFDAIAVDVGQSIVAALEAIGQTGVIDP
jgi:hypothetical protein